MSNERPQATPTPWQQNPTTYKNNPYIVPGSETQPVAEKSVPIQSLVGGGIKFSGGESVPSANVWGSGNQTVARTTQNAKLGANNTKLITDTTPTGGGGNGGGGDTGPMAGFSMSYYPGWGEAEARADWLATGGSKAKSGGGSGQKANSLDANGNEIYDASLPSLDEQANWIFQDLDKQVEGYDSFRDTMKAGLDTSVEEQKGLAKDSQASNLADLSKNATNEQNQSASTLRDLTQNANDLLARLVQMYGGGSAAEAALTGMGRTINQQRGNVLTNRDAALREIDNKKTQVDQVYNSQLEKIKNWADSKLNDINLQIKQWTNDIAQAKASTRAQLSASAVNSARNYLTTLALNQQNYQNQLDYWKQSRQAELQDYATKLQLTAQYSPQQYSWNLNPVNTSSNGNQGNSWLGNYSNGNNNNNTNDQTANIAQSDLMAKIKTNPLDSSLYDYSNNNKG